MPSQTRLCTRSTTSSLTSPCAAWPHHSKHVGRCEALFGQPVLRLLQRRRRRLDALVLGKGGGDRRMHAIGIDGAHDLIRLLVDVLSPDHRPIAIFLSKALWMHP